MTDDLLVAHADLVDGKSIIELITLALVGLAEILPALLLDLDEYVMTKPKDAIHHLLMEADLTRE